MTEDIDLSEIDKKYKDKCSLIKAGKCKNVNIFLQQSREKAELKAQNKRLKEKIIKLSEEKGHLIVENNTLKEVLDLINKAESEG